jgi:hypothetical protein
LPCFVVFLPLEPTTLMKPQEDSLDQQVSVKGFHPWRDLYDAPD